MTEAPKRELVRWLTEFSIPLIAGVLVALLLANAAPELYDHIVETPLHKLLAGGNAAHAAQATHPGEAGGHAAAQGAAWEHFFTLHFLVNDLLMVFFFGIAAKEITEACLPGGALNPPSKAINPLCGTLGGVVGPIAVFLGLNGLFGQAAWAAGWGIPTATDIALAWLAARLIFGAGHPAISFLLLLAVADDAIGLGIIAIAYPDPAHPTQWANAWWILPGMLSAYGLRRGRVTSWVPYVAIGGAMSWWGLYSAHLHPALALVFIVPFLPGPNVDFGLFVDNPAETAKAAYRESPLERFEHANRVYVDFGLFFFGLVNAGAPVSGVSGLTWIVLAALLAGKALGITAFSCAASLAGCSLPSGMNVRHLLVASVIAGLGLTVALFVSGQAYQDVATAGAAKMGALLSVLAALVAAALAIALRVSHFRVPAPNYATSRERVT